MRQLMNKAVLGLALLVALQSPGVEAAAPQHKESNASEELKLFPWVRGVPLKEQEVAYELFREANELLKESIFPQAKEKYLQALTHWDHPAIHYNLALALMNLDQPIEVYTHMEAAMRYGPEPLEQERYEVARGYKALIEKQLSTVEIACNEPGATVSMDGRTLFKAPGQYKGLVRPGIHSVVAHKEGYITTDLSRPMMPGEQVTLDLKMCTVEECTEYRRRWATWVPWAVVGSGLAVAAGGGLLHVGSSQDYKAFDTGANQQCRVPQGCAPVPEGLTTTRSRGDTLQNAAFGAYALGGAAVVTGAVLLYLNRAQPYLVKPDQRTEAVELTPLLGGDTNGILATFRF